MTPRNLLAANLVVEMARLRIIKMLHLLHNLPEWESHLGLRHVHSEVQIPAAAIHGNEYSQR